MTEYPVKEVLIEKRVQARVIIRAKSNDEAMKKAELLAKANKINYEGEQYFETEIYEEYEEGIINEEVIEKFK